MKDIVSFFQIIRLPIFMDVVLLLLFCIIYSLLFLISMYLATNVYMKLMGPVNLKKKYNAKWALVTGAGSGIGKSLSFDLAR